MIAEKELEFAFFLAGINWVMWRDCFEEQSEAAMPVLCDPDRFRQFLSGYNLLMFRNADYKQRLRDWMNRDERVKRMVKQEDGGGIECVLREMHGKRFNRERSFLSKLAAFARPDVFIAYDQYARRGVRKILSIKRNPQNNIEYLGKVQKVYDGPVSGAITEYIANRTIPTCYRTAFQLRMLDVYLMLKGGRWCRYEECQSDAGDPCSHMPCR